MCWICDKDTTAVLTTNWASFGGQAGLGRLHFGRMGEAFWDDAVSLAEQRFESPNFQFGGKLTIAFPIDGVGDFKVGPSTIAGLIGVGPDDAPNTFGPGVPTVTVHPIGTEMNPTTRTVGTLELNADQDYRQITLVAGKTYEIHMYGLAGGPNNVPLADSYIELYDAAGNFITAADGGATTPANEANSGFDVLLTFTAEASGTFYINSRAYDNDPTDGSGGEGVGDYELFVREADPNDPGTYQAYYDLDSPLHAIDWGSRLINKIHQNERNPDGNEGTRNTGNPQGDPHPYDGPNQGVSTGNPNGFPNAPAMYDDPLVDSSTDADTDPIGDPTPLTFDVPGKNVITVYYARQGEAYKFDDPSQPGLTEIVPAAGLSTFEIVSMRNALAAYADVADIQYIEVEQAYIPADPINPQLGMRAFADLTILTYNGTPGTGLLGRHSPPDEGNEGQGEYNRLGPGWNAQGLAPGGFSFVTLIHELGHGHALAHPHDTGGGSSILRGVEPEGVAFDYTTGDFDLNQAIHTIMSYEDGWPKSPYGNAPTSAGYGYQTGLSAFDIAVIQDKYGVNEEFRTGNDVYVLPEANAVATFNPDGTLATKATGYTTIWDADGTDEIQYNGGRNATIDLREATLRYEVGGGGWMSYTTGATPVYAGFTIANGAVIENASSGSGNDTLTGNAVANYLNGGAGTDTLTGRGGDDRYLVDNAGDVVLEAAGEGYDTVYTLGNYALAANSHVEVLTVYDRTTTNAIRLEGNELGNLIYGNAGANSIYAGGGADTIYGLGGDDSILVDSMSDTVFEVAGQGYDTVYTTGDFALNNFSSVEALSVYDRDTTNAMTLFGNNLSNVIYGNNGSNALLGGGGTDTFYGLGGDDRFVIDSADDLVIEYAGGGNDTVYTSASYALATDASIETLTVYDRTTSNTLNLTGNNLANTVYGNTGANTIDGKGGNDVLYGLGGADTFQFTAGPGAGNVDALADFSSVDDTIALDDQAFIGIGGLGALNANAFVTGTAAQDGNDRIVYNQATGQLFFDADGNGAGAAVLFATLNPGTNLTASDFTVI